MFTSQKPFFFQRFLPYLFVLPLDKCINPASEVAIKATVLKVHRNWSQPIIQFELYIIKYTNYIEFPDFSPCINKYLFSSSRNGRNFRLILLCSHRSEYKSKQAGLSWRVSLGCSFLSLTINVFGHISGKRSQTDKNCMETAKQTFKPGASLFHEPSDAQLAHVLNVFGTCYLHGENFVLRLSRASTGSELRNRWKFTAECTNRGSINSQLHFNEMNSGSFAFTNLLMLRF